MNNLPAVPVLAYYRNDREAQEKQSGNVPGAESPVFARATGTPAAAGNSI